MKNRMSKLVLVFVTLSSLLLATGCLVHTQPVETVVVGTHAPPSSVYYGGRTLHYRTDGYYYYDGGAWLVAPAVPNYLVTYHRPQYVGTTYYPTHSSRPVPSRPGYTHPGYSRPGYSRPGYSRPSYSQPTHSYRPSGSRPPAASGPTHVSRPGGSGVVQTPHGSRPTQGRTIQSR